MRSSVVGATHRRSLPDQFVDATALRSRVELAARVLAERRQSGKRAALAVHVDCGPVLDSKAPDRPAAVVAEEVAAARGGHRRAAVDVTGRDRARAVAAP